MGRRIPNKLQRGGQKAVVKRTIKYLSINRDPRIQKLIVSKAPDSVIKTISNAAINVLQGDIHPTEVQKRKLRRHKREIILLSNKTYPLRKKRRILQSGGFLPILAAIGAPLIGGLLGKLFGN